MGLDRMISVILELNPRAESHAEVKDPGWEFSVDGLHSKATADIIK